MSYGTTHPENTSRLKIAEVKTPVQEAIDELKQDVESTRKTREFLQKHRFDLEIETRIDAMKFVPEIPHQKRIYEQMLFGQKNAAKTILADEIKKVFEKDPKANVSKLRDTAKKVIDNWIATLAQLDQESMGGNNDGKLNYTEIIPKTEKEKAFVEHVFGTAPFFVAMENNPLFQSERPDVEVNVEAKSNFVKSYLLDFAETLIDPETGEAVAGSGIQFGRLLQSISLSVVGGKFLKNEDFAKAWDELLKNETVAKVYAEGDERERTKFARLLEKSSEQIRRLRMEADKEMTDFLAREKSNPYGFTLRKFGDLTSILYYYGSNILFMTIGINAVLSGFNPKKMAKNPVMWVMGAALLGMQNHFTPGFLSGTPKEQKIEQAKLQERFRSASAPVREWAVLFSKSDLNTEVGIVSGKQPLGNMLAEKDRSEITSAELSPLLGKNVAKPNSEILAGSNEARELFLFLRACKQRDLSPKKLDA